MMIARLILLRSSVSPLFGVCGMGSDRQSHDLKERTDDGEAGTLTCYFSDEI